MFATRMTWILTGGPLEDAARAIYDRIPMAATICQTTGERVWWARADYAGNDHWVGIKKEVRQPVARVGVAIGEFGIRWGQWR